MKEKTKSIENYEIVETLQETPEWIFYRAFDTVSKERVLIKTYLPLSKWSPSSINAFFDRLSYLKFIEHDNLLPILDFGKYRKAPYVVFPDVLELFLDTYFAQTKNDEELNSSFVQIAEALDFLHAHDITHGLLTPQNIIVTPERTLKLMDYGIYEILREILLESVQENFQNICVQNIKYASPDQILGNALSPRSDIYAFGIIFYFGLTGKLPFSGSSVTKTALFHIKQKDQILKQCAQEFSKRVFRILKKCITTDSKSVFSNFSEITLALKRLAPRRILGIFLIQSPFVKKRKSHRIKQAYLAGAILLLVSFVTIFGKEAFRKTISSLSNIPGVELAAPIIINPTPSVLPEQNLPIAPPPTETHLVQPTVKPTVEALGTHTPEPEITKPSLEGYTIRIDSEPIDLGNLHEIREVAHLGYGKPEDVAISPDQKYYAIATSGGVFIFDQGNVRKYWINTGDWATSIIFSSDGKLLGVGLLSGEIQIWDWKNEIKVSELKRHTARVSAVLFSVNGHILYSASDDQHVIAWNLTSQETLQLFQAHSDPINVIAVSPDGRIIVTGSTGNVSMWDLSTGQRLYEFPFSGKVEALAISSDGEYLAVGGNLGVIRQWSIKSKQLRTDPIPVKSRIWRLEYSRNDTTLFAGLDDGKSVTYNSSTMSYPGISLDFKVRAVDSDLYDVLGAQYEFSSSFAPYTDGRDSVSVQWNGLVTNRGKNVLTQNYGTYDRLSFSQSSAIIAVGSKLGVTSVWSIPDTHLLFRENVTLPRGEPIAPDDRYIVVSPSEQPADKPYLRFQGLNGRESTILRAALPNSVVSFSQNGTLLVSNTVTSSNIWDIQTGDEIYFQARNDRGCRITSSTNNNEILRVNSVAGDFASWSDQVRNICVKSYLYRDSLTDVSDNLELLVYLTQGGGIEGFDTLANDVIWRYRPSERVTALSTSANGDIVALGFENGQLFFLDGMTGDIVFEIRGNYGTITAVKFSVDRSWIATSGTDGVVRLFGVGSEK